jgi:predicted nucleic acid-binding protein
VIVVDTSIIVAYMNAGDDHHEAVAGWLDDAEDDLATTPLIVAEADHLISARGGPAALRALRADLVAGAYLVDWWPAAITSAVNVAERYADTGLGLADASLVALAERLDTINIATLDERHFRAVRTLTTGEAFRLLPADA